MSSRDSASAEPKTDDMENLANSMKKISIKLKVPTPEEHAAKQQKILEDKQKKPRARKPAIPKPLKPAKPSPSAPTDPFVAIQSKPAGIPIFQAPKPMEGAAVPTAPPNQSSQSHTKPRLQAENPSQPHRVRTKKLSMINHQFPSKVTITSMILLCPLANSNFHLLLHSRLNLPKSRAQCRLTRSLLLLMRNNRRSQGISQSYLRCLHRILFSIRLLPLAVVHGPHQPR